MGNIIDTIGNTPLVEITSFHQNPKVKIYAKLEGNNPAGSVKDRPALNMISSAIERGDIKKGDKLIEATSGNTGIALAMIASMYGMELELVMPSRFTGVSKLTVEGFGDKVILLDNVEVCREYAEEKAERDGIYILNQLAKPDDCEAHVKVTGPEIWRDTGGQITHFVSAMGT